LNDRQRSPGQAATEQPVRHFCRLELLVRLEELCSAVIGEIAGTSRRVQEVCIAQHPARSKADNKAVSHGWPEFLDQVEGQRGPSSTDAVKEPDLGVQPDRLQRPGHLAEDDPVGEAEKGVDGVSGRSAISTVEHQR
jgi:hypothetical protein